MIGKLSAYIVRLFIKQSVIRDEEQELYTYGFFMLLSQIIFLILACVYGLIFGCFFESIIFFIAFQFIRRYAGGYHAATETRCEIMSALSMAVCVGVIKLSKIYGFHTVLLAAGVLSAVCIFCLCPLDTPEKPLSEKEVKHYRKVSWLILLVIAVLMLVSYIFSIELLLAPSCLSLILESILLAAGKIKRKAAGKIIDGV